MSSARSLHIDKAFPASQLVTRQAVDSQRGRGMHRSIEKLFRVLGFPPCSALLVLDNQGCCSVLKNIICCRLYVHTMRNPGLAEAYCDRMYNAVAKQQGRSMRPVLWGSYGEPSNYNMYLALIQVALSLVVSNEWTRCQITGPVVQRPSACHLSYMHF